MGWKSPTLAVKMSPDLPDWLKKSISAQSNQKKEGDASEADRIRKSQIDEREHLKAVGNIVRIASHYVGLWKGLRIDEDLDSVNKLLGGNFVSSPSVRLITYAAGGANYFNYDRVEGTFFVNDQFRKIRTRSIGEIVSKWGVQPGSERLAEIESHCSYHWTTPSSGGIFEATGEMGHSRDLFSLEMRSDGIWASEEHDGEHARIATLNGLDAIGLKRSIDDFTSKLIAAKGNK